MSALREAPVTIDSGRLRLEGLLHEGDGAGAAVVLHPHPQYGGDMHNHVVAAACATLARAGLATLRFNFRGTGRSDGAYDGGRGESDDARAAVAFLRERAAGGPLVLCGYSFGAMVAAGVAGDVRPDALVLISPPLQVSAIAVPDGVRALVIAGDRDPIVPAHALARLERPDVRVVVVPGVEHSWWPGVEELEAQLAAFVGGILRESPTGGRP
jgi:alpha/beta superfamily hydrolase